MVRAAAGTPGRGDCTMQKRIDRRAVGKVNSCQPQTRNSHYRVSAWRTETCSFHALPFFSVVPMAISGRFQSMILAIRSSTYSTGVEVKGASSLRK
jgi:hypothetical protein